MSPRQPAGRSGGRFRRARIAAAAAALCALAVAFSAEAEVAQKDGLRIALEVAVHPTRLPRTAGRPVAVSISSQISKVDRTLPPQLKLLRIELNRHGRLDTTGLPTCPVSEIQPASTARALAACRPALVGRGSLSVDVVLGGQDPYPTTGRILLFNGSYKGRPALLGQIYAAHPFANSFVIPFRIQQLRHGPYGIALSAVLPPAFNSWGHITGLQLRLARRYRYRNRRHSFISARCPAPKGIRVAPIQLARARFVFADATRLTETVASSCSVLARR